MRNYLKANLIALDQLGNTLLGGSPDETLSARAYRVEQKGRLWGRLLRPAIDLVFRAFERDHCRLSYLSEVSRSQFPGDYNAPPAESLGR